MEGTQTFPGKRLGWIFFLLALVPQWALGCTIFVLTEEGRVLFCNNEDWSNTTTRVWFVPAGKGYYGCAFVGFDDGVGQGGLNTEGLAYDWVAGFESDWVRKAEHQPTWGIPTHRMLETCASVEEAIRFYRSHYEPGFKTARVLVADKTGASVIIGVKGGELMVERSHQCRGFGYARITLDKALSDPPEPTVANAAKILRACRQQGQYATKYSNVFDLKSGEMFLFAASGPKEGVGLKMAAELAKGPHYYDLPQLQKQKDEPPKTLRKEMQRVSPEDFRPAEKSATDQRIRELLQKTISGRVEEKDYSPEMWKKIKPDEVQGELKALGAFIAATPVLPVQGGEPGTFYYRMEFSRATLVQAFKFDGRGRVKTSETRYFQLKP